MATCDLQDRQSLPPGVWSLWGVGQFSAGKRGQLWWEFTPSSGLCLQRTRQFDAFGFSNCEEPTDFDQAILRDHYQDFEDTVTFNDDSDLDSFGPEECAIRTDDLQTMIEDAFGRKFSQGAILLALDLIGYNIRQLGNSKYGVIYVSKQAAERLLAYVESLQQ